MIDVADEKAGPGRRRLGLRVAFHAQIGIALHEHFGVDGAVGVVADGAAFAQGGVFEDKGTGLFAMALGASLILAGHGQSARGLHDIHAVGIVALHAVHFAFDDRVMLREVKFSPGFLVALETSFGVFAGIDDEFFEPAAAGHGDVFAGRTVAGFAAALAGHFGIGNSQPRVGTAREHAGDIGMTVKTRLVADVGGAFDLKGNDHRPVGGTGVEQQNERCCAGAKH